MLGPKALAAAVGDLGHRKPGMHLMFWVRLQLLAEIQAEARNWHERLILQVARAQPSVKKH